MHLRINNNSKMIYQVLLHDLVKNNKFYRKPDACAFLKRFRNGH